jgi:small nuclear ribonucleoprotein (snRNP)-like protein
MKPRLQFEKYLGAKVSIKMDDGNVFVGTLENEDWQFLHLTNCKVKTPKSRKFTSRPAAVVRKLFIQNLVVLEDSRGEAR